MSARILWRLAAIVAVLLPVASQAQLPDFTRLVEEQGSAVVNVSTTQSRVSRAAPGAPGTPAPNVPPDDPFYEFFRRFVPPPGQGGPPRDHEGASLGLDGGELLRGGGDNRIPGGSPGRAVRGQSADCNVVCAAV